MAILSKASKTDNFESHNSLKLYKYLRPSFKFCWLWIFPWIKLSWHFCSVWENSADSYLCFRLALLHSVSYFFFLYRSHTSYLCTVFDSISSNIDDVHSINPSANVFVFGDLTSIIRTGFPILVELINLVNSSIISNDLTQMVNFPTWIPNCDSHSLALWDLFLSSDTSIPSAMAFPPLEILIMLLSQLPLTFHQLHNRMLHFIA